MGAYVCYANPNPEFMPAMRLISAITRANPAQVTTTFAHGYVTGTIVRIDIPKAVGMVQLNKQVVPIIVTAPTTFTIGIDTTMFDPFAIPVTTNPTIDICPQVVPVGELNGQLTAALHNVLG